MSRAKELGYAGVGIVVVMVSEVEVKVRTAPNPFKRLPPPPSNAILMHSKGSIACNDAKERSNY